MDFDLIGDVLKHIDDKVKIKLATCATPGNIRLVGCIASAYQSGSTDMEEMESDIQEAINKLTKSERDKVFDLLAPAIANALAVLALKDKPKKKKEKR